MWHQWPEFGKFLSERHAAKSAEDKKPQRTKQRPCDEHFSYSNTKKKQQKWKIIWKSSQVPFICIMEKERYVINNRHMLKNLEIY